MRLRNGFKYPNRESNEAAHKSLRKVFELMMETEAKELSTLREPPTLCCCKSSSIRLCTYPINVDEFHCPQVLSDRWFTCIIKSRRAGRTGPE